MSDRIEIIPLAPKRILRRGRDRTMPARFEALAVWNAERARGLVHTPGWDAKMTELQREFGAWHAESPRP